MLTPGRVVEREKKKKEFELLHTHTHVSPANNDQSMFFSSVLSLSVARVYVIIKKHERIPEKHDTFDRFSPRLPHIVLHAMHLEFKFTRSTGQFQN